jgi:hypothetical protein
MFEFAYVFKFIIDTLDDRPLPEQYSVICTDILVFHILSGFGNKLRIKEQIVPGRYTLCRRIVYRKDFQSGLQDFEITVVNIGLGEVKRENFPFIVDYQVQFEAEAPAYRTLASLSNASEGFVLVYPSVVANPQRCRIHKTYPGGIAESFMFEKKHERNGHPFL